MSDYYISHSGILGMKWGKKNGPPYPLSYKDLSPEEREKSKSKAIRSGNVVEANNNKQYYSDDEIRQVTTRYKLNSDLSDLAAKDIAKGKKSIEDITKKIERGTKFAEASINAYNIIAKVANSLGDKDLKVIGEKKEKPKKSKAYTKESLKDILENQHKYTDDEIKDILARARNIDSLEKIRKNDYKVNDSDIENTLDKMLKERGL